jgi:hypothetical protein
MFRKPIEGRRLDLVLSIRACRRGSFACGGFCAWRGARAPISRHPRAVDGTRLMTREEIDAALQPITSAERTRADVRRARTASTPTFSNRRSAEYFRLVRACGSRTDRDSTSDSISVFRSSAACRSPAGQTSVSCGSSDARAGEEIGTQRACLTGPPLGRARGPICYHSVARRNYLEGT